MRLPSLVIAALLTGMVPATAAAQAQISVPANASWQHAQTKLIVRAKLAGLARTEIRDATTSELDVSVQYGSTATTAATLYLFRPALQSVAMWFDRSETQILSRDAFPGITPHGAAAAFVPPQAKIASALKRIYALPSGALKSTGLAVIPLGDWLVVVRVSSAEFDADHLGAKLDEIVAGLGWPEAMAEAGPATPILPCATPLAFARKAKIRKPDMTDALIGAAIGGIAADKKPEGPPPLWCRDGTPTTTYGVYRAGGTDTGYVMAIGDAGRTIEVRRGFALAKDDPGFPVSFGDLDRTLVFPSFDKLPAPQAALDAVRKGRPISSSKRGSKDITISM